MRTLRKATILLGAGTLILAACGEPGGESTTTAPTLTTDSTTTTALASSTTSLEEPVNPEMDPLVGADDKEKSSGELPEGAAPIVEAAIADLADRLFVDVDVIGVLSVEPMLWNDGSLGCPEPGVAYTQAVVEGYWILLSADGNAYDYRASDNGFVKLCESGPAPTTAPSS